MDWYPWYPQLYEADTLHLTLAEHGAYRRLIDFYMSTGQPLPDDDRKLAALLRVSPDEWASIAKTVREFFILESGKLLHKHCERELKTMRTLEFARSKAGKIGAKARWKHKHKPRENQEKEDNASANAIAMRPHMRFMPQTDRQTNIQTYRQTDSKQAVSVSYWEVSPLTDNDLERARKEFPGYDIEQAEREWMAWAASCGMLPPRKPGVAFLGWLDKRDWKKGNGYDH